MSFPFLTHWYAARVGKEEQQLALGSGEQPRAPAGGTGASAKCALFSSGQEPHAGCCWGPNGPCLSNGCLSFNETEHSSTLLSPTRYPQGFGERSPVSVQPAVHYEPEGGGKRATGTECCQTWVSTKTFLPRLRRQYR